MVKANQAANQQKKVTVESSQNKYHMTFPREKSKTETKDPRENFQLKV